MPTPGIRCSGARHQDLSGVRRKGRSAGSTAAPGGALHAILLVGGPSSRSSLGCLRSRSPPARTCRAVGCPSPPTRGRSRRTRAAVAAEASVTSANCRSVVAARGECVGCVIDDIMEVVPVPLSRVGLGPVEFRTADGSTSVRSAPVGSPCVELRRSSCPVDVRRLARGRCADQVAAAQGPVDQPACRIRKRSGSAGSRSTTRIGGHAHCHTLMPGVRENRICPRVPSTATCGHDAAMRARSAP